MRYIFSLLLLAFAAADNENDLLVEIKNGALRGKYASTKNGRRIAAFTGIPYARPPIGELRFQPPQPAENWHGILDASETHAVCPQRNSFVRSPVVEGNEDCLYLNVYTPAKSERKEPLPVMLFFHGGGWFACSGNDQYYGPDILLDRDVVLVVPNYRLGPLGLFSTGDEVVPGNNALKDQALTLKWIHENIKSFGGDANSITVFGESAGGATAHFFMLSPLTKGLFHAAISESGTALNPWSLSPNFPKGNTVRNSKKLGKLLNCPEGSSEELVECLRKVDAHKIIEQDDQFWEWDNNPVIPFQPVIEPKHEGAFLDAHPIDLIKQGRVHAVPWIVGLNSADGALKTAPIFALPSLLEEFNDDLNYKIGTTLMMDEHQGDENVVDKIRQYYYGDKRVNVELIKNTTDLYTDAFFLSGSNAAIELHKKYLDQEIYYYVFDHRGVASFTEVFGDPHNDYGVCHADELQYLFPVGDNLFPTKKMDEKDKRMVEVLTGLWTNFARNKKPNLIWKPVEETRRIKYLHIAAPDDLEMKDGLYQERTEFWRSINWNAKLTEVEAAIKEEL